MGTIRTHRWLITGTRYRYSREPVPVIKFQKNNNEFYETYRYGTGTVRNLYGICLSYVRTTILQSYCDMSLSPVDT